MNAINGEKTSQLQTNSKKQQLVTESDGSLTAHLKSLPVDGKANQELIELLSKSFEVPKPNKAQTILINT